jgi:hypothetical protein
MPSSIAWRRMLVVLLAWASASCMTTLDHASILSSCDVDDVDCERPPAGDLDIYFRGEYYPLVGGQVSNNAHRDQLALGIDGVSTGAFTGESSGIVLNDLASGKHTYTLHAVNTDTIEDGYIPGEEELGPVAATLPDLALGSLQKVVVAYGEPHDLDLVILDPVPDVDVPDHRVRFTILNVDPSAPLDVLSWPDANPCGNQPTGRSVVLVDDLGFGKLATFELDVAEAGFLTDGSGEQRLRGDSTCGSASEMLLWLPPFDWSPNRFNYFWSVAWAFREQAACEARWSPDFRCP